MYGPDDFDFFHGRVGNWWERGINGRGKFSLHPKHVSAVVDAGVAYYLEGKAILSLPPNRY